MKKPTPWHRLLGMVLTGLFTDRPWRVELAQELALKSQRLDILSNGRRVTRRPWIRRPSPTCPTAWTPWPRTIC
jgi:hypothetical protein